MVGQNYTEQNLISPINPVNTGKTRVRRKSTDIQWQKYVDALNIIEYAIEKG